MQLLDVLDAARLQGGIAYTAKAGADAHFSGDPEKLPIRRALTSTILIAIVISGDALHQLQGTPLRLVVPGWPGSRSQKWLTQIWRRDHVHEVPKITGTLCRVLYPRLRQALQSLAPKAVQNPYCAAAARAYGNFRGRTG